MSPCLFNFYAKYIMVNARLDESQAGVKTARRNINNSRCAEDTTLIAESGEELKVLLKRVKEESEKSCLKLNILKTKIMESSPITSWQIQGGNVEAMKIYFSWAPKSWWKMTAVMKLKDACSLEGRLPRQHF